MEETRSAFDSFESTLSEIAISYIKESAKWSRFLAILGFIGIGIFVLIAIYMAAMMSNMNSGFMPFPPMLLSLIYLFIAALYFMPVYYLYNYGVKINKALNERNQNLLTEGFENLKSHHKFLGISAIVVISIYALIFIFGIAAAIL